MKIAVSLCLSKWKKQAAMRSSKSFRRLKGHNQPLRVRGQIQRVKHILGSANDEGITHPHVSDAT
jgi:hypothetical protein